MAFKPFEQVLLVLLFILVVLTTNGCSQSEYNYEWELTFEDNFEFFDSTKWITHFNNGSRTIWSNKELQWYKDENVKVENGVLKLYAIKESIYGKDTESEKQFEFTSGMICNPRSHPQAYGKWEMRVKFPFKKGFWPAFFLAPVNQIPGLPEIDVFEYFGIHENKISVAHHWGLDYPNWGGIYEGKSEPFYYVKGKEIEGNFSNVWMVWSFECFPDKMVWKLNNKIVYETREGIPTAPLYMIANVAIKDWEANNFEVDDSDLPYIMEIEYVRIYRMVPRK